MILIITALRTEADPFISELRLRPNKEIRGLYTSPSISVLHAGVGKNISYHKINMSITHCEPNEIINIGCAGALSGQKHGEIYEISLCMHHKNPLQTFHLPTKNIFHPARLITVSEPALTPQSRKTLTPFADIVDMECASIAEICIKNEITLFAVKVISDATHDTDESIIRLRIRELSRILADNVIRKYLRTNTD